MALAFDPLGSCPPHLSGDAGLLILTLLVAVQVVVGIAAVLLRAVVRQTRQAP